MSVWCVPAPSLVFLHQLSCVPMLRSTSSKSESIARRGGSNVVGLACLLFSFLAASRCSFSLHLSFIGPSFGFTVGCLVGFFGGWTPADLCARASSSLVPNLWPDVACHTALCSCCCVVGPIKLSSSLATKPPLKVASNSLALSVPGKWQMKNKKQEREREREIIELSYSFWCHPFFDLH